MKIVGITFFFAQKDGGGGGYKKNSSLKPDCIALEVLIGHSFHTQVNLLH